MWSPLTIIAGGAAVGAILRASLEPYGVFWTPPLAITLAIAILQGQRVSAWMTCGFVAGLVWHATIPLALLSWGPSLICVGWFVPGLFLGAFFGVVGYLDSIAPMGARWACWAVAWTFFAPVFESLQVPMAFCAGLVARHHQAIAVVRTIGVNGCDAILLTIGAGVADILLTTGGRWHGQRLRGAILVATALGVLGLGALVAAPPLGKVIQFHAVQTAIASAAFRRAQWSLGDRSEIEHSIDELIASALVRDPGLVVLPEGGNNLFNARLIRRRRALRDMFATNDSELLLSGADLSPDGRQYNVVQLVNRTGFQETAQKARPVFLAEKSLTAGAPRVLRTRYGDVGVSICFDAVFGSHVRELVDHGAEVLVTVADGASFGTTYLTELHVAYARLRALEVGRPMLFVGNRGPVLAVDSSGRETFRVDQSDRQTLHDIRIAGTTESTISTRGGRWLIPLLCVIFLGWLAIQTRITLTRTGMRRPSFVLAAPILHGGVLVVVTGLAAVAHEIVATHYWRPISLSDLIGEYVERGAASKNFDAMSIGFRQAGQATCGPAALAYALTILGDEVFEEELVTSMPAVDPSGYTFEELALMATRRGFGAQGFQGDLESLPKNGEPPIIAHLKVGHYVAVLRSSRDGVTLFDPAAGRVLQVPRPDFESVWSSRYLRLSTRELGPSFLSSSQPPVAKNERP